MTSAKEARWFVIALKKVEHPLPGFPKTNIIYNQYPTTPNGIVGKYLSASHNTSEIMKQCPQRSRRRPSQNPLPHKPVQVRSTTTNHSIQKGLDITSL